MEIEEDLGEDRTLWEEEIILARLGGMGQRRGKQEERASTEALPPPGQPQEQAYELGYRRFTRSGDSEEARRQAEMAPEREAGSHMEWPWPRGCRRDPHWAGSAVCRPGVL